MTLDEALNQAAREGRLSINLFAISDGYQASLSMDGKGWRVEMAADPATALKKVLGLLPGASGPLREAAPVDGGVFD